MIGANRAERHRGIQELARDEVVPTSGFSAFAGIEWAHVRLLDAGPSPSNVPRPRGDRRSTDLP